MDKDFLSQWKLLSCMELPVCFSTRMSWTHTISFGIFFTSSDASWFSYYKRKSLSPFFFNLMISKPSPLSPIPHHLYSNLFSMSKIIQSFHTLFFNREGIITDLISMVWKLISYWPKEIYTQIQHIHRRDRFFSAINPWTKVVKNRNSSSWYQSNKKTAHKEQLCHKDYSDISHQYTL